MLRPATSGTSIDRLPRLLPQAGTLALSPDGRTLYEFLQAGGPSGRTSSRSSPSTLAAITS